MLENQKNYENLAHAIILKAVSDYRRSNCAQTRTAIKRFFRSEWFYVLTKVDGEMLIQKLEQERLEKNE